MKRRTNKRVLVSQLAKSFGSTKNASTGLWLWSEGSKTRRVLLTGCVRCRGEGDRPPSCSWHRLGTLPVKFTSPRQRAPCSWGWCGTLRRTHQVAQGQTQLGPLPPHPPRWCPRLDSLMGHSLLHLPVLKPQSQMLKQHPTGVLYQSKQPGKIYDNGSTDLFPLTGIKRSGEYSIWCRSELDALESGIHSTHQK